MVNVIYGILADGRTGINCLRYSDCVANSKQRSLLSGLVPSDAKNRGAFIDYVLKLLSCTPVWPKLIRELDPNNTYDVCVLDTADTLNFSPLQAMLDWEKLTSIKDERFPYSDLDPAIDRITAKLAAILMLSNSENDRI